MTPSPRCIIKIVKAVSARSQASKWGKKMSLNCLSYFQNRKKKRKKERNQTNKKTKTKNSKGSTWSQTKRLEHQAFPYCNTFIPHNKVTDIVSLWLFQGIADHPQGNTGPGWNSFKRKGKKGEF